MHHLSSLLSFTFKPVRLVAVLLLLLAGNAARAQSVLSGTVTDLQGKPLSGASVYLDNTIDGGTTDSTGAFRFSTTEKGAQTLVVSGVGYQNSGMPVNVDAPVSGISIRLKASATSLDEVTITAGAFEASSDKDKTVFKPLDIVTTAGANADIVKAIQTLPGTQQQGSQTGLFVRGGDASEAAVVVDELVVQNAFFSSAPGVAARSRFSPFQFKGISFSSGGYSARYGQALSSVLELNTLDLPDKSTINTGFNMAGVYFSASKLWKNSGGEATAYYNNLQPFYGIAKTNFDFYDVPKGGGGSAKYAWKPNKDGLIKVMGNFQAFKSGIGVDNPDSPGQRLDMGLNNVNTYGSVSYRQMFGSKWSLYTAGLYSYNKGNNTWDGMPTPQEDQRGQLRLEVKRFFASKFNLLVGTELQHFRYERSFGSWWGNQFTENHLAGYAEAEWSPVRWLALRPGVRVEHSTLLEQTNVSPRVSMAVRTGRYSQVSLAGGLFYQNPDVNYLLYGYRPDFQEAIHYIANWQYSKDNRVLRLEAYYKDYRHLVREYGTTEYNPNNYRYAFGDVNNSGKGYAKGLEVFWRDKKTVKNLDYWLSYSYIDTKRLYKNFTAEATPDFISDHNLNLITKYWIDKWQTSVNMSYNYASGRPYYNPSNPEFLGDRTSDFHNLSLTVNYLTHVKKWFTVIYAGIDNVTDRHNIFGYRYSSDGQTRFPVRPALYRSFFIGVNFSLTEFDKDEL